MENYVRIYSTNIKIRKARTKERGGRERERIESKNKKKCLKLGGHIMGKNCNRKIIPQQLICTQQYLFEPSGME